MGVELSGKHLRFQCFAPDQKYFPPTYNLTDVVATSGLRRISTGDDLRLVVTLESCEHDPSNVRLGLVADTDVVTGKCLLTAVKTRLRAISASAGEVVIRTLFPLVGSILSPVIACLSTLPGRQRAR